MSSAGTPPKKAQQELVSPLADINSQLDEMIAAGKNPQDATVQPNANPVTTAPPPEPPAEPAADGEPAAPTLDPAPKKGIVTRALSAVGGAVAGLAAGIGRVPGQAAGATMDLAQDAYEATGINTGQRNLGHWLESPDHQFFPGQKNIGAAMLADPMLDRKGTFADTLSARKYLGSIGNSAINQGTAELGSIVLGAGGLSEVRLGVGLAKLAPKVGKILDVAGQSGAAAFGLMDPNSSRVSSMLSNLGVHSEFTDWLGSNDKDASHFEGRFKNALEGVGLGGATEAAFLGSKYLYALAKGTPEAAAGAKAAADTAFKKITPEAAHPQETITGKAPDGTITANGEPTVKFSSSEAYDNFINQARDPAPKLDEPGATAADLGAEPKAAPNEPMPPLNDPANVGPMLRQMAIDLHDTPHIVKTDPEMYTRAEQIAREVGVDPTDLMAAAQNISGKMTDIDSAVTAMRGGWHKVAADFEPFAARGIDAMGDHELPALKAAIHNLTTYSGYFANIRSQSGRLLRSLGHDDLEQYLAKGDKEAVTGPFAGQPIKPLPQTRQELGDFMEMWNDTKNNPALRMDFLQGAQAVPSAFKYARTSLANWFTASALSGLPSLSMNIVGPAIIGVLQTTEKTMGGAVRAMLEKDPERRAELIATSANAARAYVQTMGDLSQVLKYAAQAFQSNRPILGGGGTVNDLVSNMGPITPAMIRSASGQDAPTYGYALGNAINFLPRQFQRLNAGLDEFAKRLSYNGETRLQALVDGAKQGLSGDAMRTFVKKAMQESIEMGGENAGAATSASTLRDAERTTFTGSLTGNKYAPNVGKFAGAINSLRRDVPEFRYIAPVFNVPANSVGETLRRIPGLNLMLGETRDELLGHMGAVRQADAYGRTMMGGLFMLHAYGLARSGLLTGAGPTDPKDRQEWSLSHQPYSVKVGDHWVGYARYDLPGSLFAIPATLFDKTVNRNSAEDMSMAMLGGAGAMAQYFKDKAALQGISQLMDFGGNPSSDLSYMERLVGNTGARMMVPNFVTQLGRNTIDPEKRAKASIGDYFTDALPWASKELDPMRNVMGEPQFKPNQTLLENGLPITISSTKPNDTIIKELDRVYQSTGYAPGLTTPGEISGGSTANGYYDPREVKLENGRSMYDAIISARSKPSLNLEEGSMRHALDTLFKSEEYQTATYGNSNALFDPDGHLSKTALLSKAFSDYNKDAIKTVAAQSPIARKYLAVSAVKRIYGDKLRAYSADKLVNTPGLLDSLNINIQDFEDRFAQ
jgi:hypothetical protein